MAEITITLDETGRAYLRLSSAEVRDSVALDGLEQADGIPALDAIVLGREDGVGQRRALSMPRI